jgi:hypothetical protein
MPPDTAALPESPAAGAPSSPETERDRPREAWPEIVKLANAIRALHRQEQRGDLAALRRMDTERATELAFHRILARVALDASRARAQRLALLTKILALATRLDVLETGRRNLGAALDAAGVSEARVQMLMTARGEALDDLLLRTARRLVRDGLLPFEDLGRLILGSPEEVERTRFRIAKAYWAAAARREAGENTEPAPNQPTGEDQ